MKADEERSHLSVLFYLLAFIIFIAFAVYAYAAVPQKINYQGYLTNATGTPVSATLTVVFSIYDVPTGGTSLWTESQSVTITDGVYSVNLGDVTPIALPFDTQYYLGVQVGTDAEMTPRVPLTSVPYAFTAGYALSAPIGAGTITSSHIQDGTITNADISGGAGIDISKLSGVAAAGHAHSAGEISGTVGIAQGGTGATTAGAARAGLGAAASGANTDITSLAGLTTPLSIAQGGTGSSTKNFVDLSTDQTIGGSKTFSNQIRSNVTTGTAPLQVASTTMVSNLNAEMLGGYTVSNLDSRYDARYGQAVALQNPRSNIITTVETTGISGWYSSITIGTDGLPVISYYRSSYLGVTKCGNPSCSSGNTTTQVDPELSVGEYTSIVIGTDGLPVISHYNYGDLDLKVVKCGNASCSSGNIITTVDSTGDVGKYSSIAMGTDELPIISYYDATNGDLKVLKCGDSSCSSSNTITAVDSTGTVGKYTSITVGTDGLPIISYYDETNSALKVAKCGDSSCSSSSIVTLDSTGVTGEDTSITIGADGLPIISYYDWTNHDLKVVKCGDAACSSGNTVTTVDSTGDVGWRTSITIGTDGLPMISYHDYTNRDLKFVKCGDTSCSSNNTIVTLDSGGEVGDYSSITIGTDGLPIISYFDSASYNLKVVKCANSFCINNWSRR